MNISYVPVVETSAVIFRQYIESKVKWSFFWQPDIEKLSVVYGSPDDLKLYQIKLDYQERSFILDVNDGQYEEVKKLWSKSFDSIKTRRQIDDRIEVIIDGCVVAVTRVADKLVHPFVYQMTDVINRFENVLRSKEIAKRLADYNACYHNHMQS